MRDYLRSKGVSFIEMGDGKNIIPDHCFFCAGVDEDKKQTKNKRWFIVDATKNVYNCFKCGASGNMISLKKHFGDSLSSHFSDSPKRKMDIKPIKIDFDKYEQIVLEATTEIHNAEAGKKHRVMKYLLNRGLTEETIEKFQFGAKFRFSPTAQKEGWFVVIPVYNSDNKPVLIKYRSAYKKGKRAIEREKGGVTLPFGLNHLSKNNYDRIFIVEGEIDAMTLSQYGYENVIGMTAGAKTSMNKTVLDILAPYKKVYIMFDTDEVGRNTAQELSKKIGAWRCNIVELPYKDANECLQQGVLKSSIDEIIKQATPILRRLSDFHDDFVEKYITNRGEGILGVTTGIESLDMIIDGWQYPNFYFITGKPGSGKSTFANYLTYLKASLYPEENILYFSLEIRNMPIYIKFMKLVTETKLIELTKEKADEARNEIENLPVIMWNADSNPKTTEMEELLTYAVNVHQFNYVVIDHLFFIVDQTDTKAVFQFLKHLSDLSKKLNIIILGLGHFTKFSEGKGDLDNTKGGSDVAQLVDYFIRVHRYRTEDRNDSTEAQVSVLKNRHNGREGSIKFNFVPKSSKYEELSRATLNDDGVLDIEDISSPAAGSGLFSNHSTTPKKRIKHKTDIVFKKENKKIKPIKSDKREPPKEEATKEAELTKSSIESMGFESPFEEDLGF